MPVEYAVVVGDRSEAKRLLEEKIRELGEGALVVMGSHGRRGISRLLWGSKAEEVVRECPCPVLVVKAPSPRLPEVAPAATATVGDLGPPTGSSPPDLGRRNCLLTVWNTPGTLFPNPTTNLVNP